LPWSPAQRNNRRAYRCEDAKVHEHSHSDRS
jgi:hypothetical protein